MRFERGLYCLCLTFLGAFAWSPTFAQDDLSDYVLGDNSMYFEGCFDPCDCPLEAIPIVGSFDLVFAGVVGTDSVYDVSNLDFQSGLDAALPFSITGTGEYRLSMIDDSQSVTLDLLINGVPKLLTSGSVPTEATFPAIEIDASENGFFCDDFALHIQAGPGPKFSRGDCNSDGSRDVGDAIVALDLLFSPVDVAVLCEKACDTNDDGLFNIADPIQLLAHLFNPDGLSFPLAEPFPGCGPDMSLDLIECLPSPACP